MILDDFRLDQQVAVVTGGSRGLGLSAAKALAQAGAHIVNVQRTNNSAQVKSAVAEAGRELLTVSLDVAETDAAQRVLDATLARFGRVDILVNNAGITKRTPSAEYAIEDWDQLISTNLRSVFIFCQVFGREMLKQKRGKIINMGSLLSFQGGLRVPAYAASKHAVSGLTKALCNEWSSQGINVNCIAPGYMATDMNVPLMNDPVRSRQIGERIPAGRWGESDDIGGLTVFLASRTSDFIHGQTIAVDGGWMAR